MFVLIDEIAALDRLLFTQTISYLVRVRVEDYLSLLAGRRPKASPYPIVEQLRRLN